MRTLLLEDSGHARKMIELLLRAVGCRVVSDVGSVHEALMSIRERDSEFEVALLDHDLPDGKGSEVALALRRARGSGVKIISISAHAREDMESTPQELALYDVFLQKPFTLEELRAAV